MMRDKLKPRPVVVGRRCLTLVVALTLVSSAVTDAVAQRRSPQSQLAVDVVRLRSGERLLGEVLGEAPDGALRIAVQRNWLRDAEPEFFRTVVADEVTTQQRITSELLERIGRWITDVEARPGDATGTQQLLGFLQDQQRELRQRLEQLQAEPPAGNGRDAEARGLDTQFLLLELPPQRVASRQVQPAGQRRIALLAWRERFREVETLSAEQLRDALESRNIDVADDGEPVDLSDRVPPEAQSDDEWAARQAIVEFQLLRRLEYQGLSGALVRTDGEAPPLNLEALLPQLLQSQLTSQLADLLDEPGLGGARPKKPQSETTLTALAPAIREAEQLGRRGFRVTQLDLDLARSQTRVTEQFVARMPDGQWRVVWSDTVTEDARQARAAAEEQIGNDPQIKQLLQLAEQLGGAGDQVKTAVRFGAATMAAQQRAAARFFQFRDRHTQRVDGPPLTLGQR